MKKNFLFNTIILISSTFLLQIVQIFFGIYISNTIGEESVGIFSLVMSVYLFGITLASAGINIASTRVISNELAYNNKIGIRKSSKYCILISFIFGICASFIFFIFADFITSYCLNNHISKNVIYLICIALPCISMSSAMNGYFIAIRKAYKNAFAKFGEEFVKIFFSIFLLKYFAPTSTEYICFFLIMADVISEISSFFHLFILYFHDRKKFIITSRYTDLDNYRQKILHISLPIALTSYLRSGLSTIKQLLIPSSLQKGGMNSSNSLISYGIITGMAMPIIMFPVSLISSFSSLLVPEFSQYYAQRNYKKIKNMSIFILTLFSIFSLIITFFIFLFSDKLSILIYHKYEIAKYLRLLSPLITFIYLDIVIDSILKGLDAQIFVMIINILDCIISISLIYFVVPLLGFSGYILSLFISELVNFSLSGYILWKKCNCSII